MTYEKVVEDPLVRWISQSWVREPAEAGAGPVFAVLRIPFDRAVSYRPGTRFGPAGVLAALNGLSLYCTDKRVSLETARFLDCGEVDLVHSLEESYRSIATAVAAIPAGLRPVLLGGDHSITDPIVRGLQRREPGRPFGLIVLDAHFDSREPVPGKEHSGHWMRTLGDVIDYSRVAQLGINANIYSDHYMRGAEASGVLVRTPYDIRRRGWPRIVEEALEHATRDTRGVYVSVDIDSVDQAFAPGTSVPNPAGFQPHEVMDAVFELSARADVVGFDLTEVSPPLDRLDATSQVGAHIVLNHVAGTVLRAGAGTSPASTPDRSSAETATATVGPASGTV